jgi:hypothetical protein
MLAKADAQAAPIKWRELVETFRRSAQTPVEVSARASIVDGVANGSLSGENLGQCVKTSIICRLCSKEN